MTSRVNVDAHAFAVKVKQGDQETMIEPHGNKTFFVSPDNSLTIEEVPPADDEKSEAKEDKSAALHGVSKTAKMPPPGAASSETEKSAS